MSNNPKENEEPKDGPDAVEQDESMVQQATTPVGQGDSMTTITGIPEGEVTLHHEDKSNEDQ